MIVKFDPEAMPVEQFGRTPEAIDYLQEFLERGEKVENRHPKGIIGTFNRETDVAWDSHDNIYVADGYGNSRVVRPLAEDGGNVGNRPGNVLHGIAIDNQDNIYIADRNNNRIQVYDTELNYNKTYTGMGSPWSVCVSPGSPQYLFSGDGTTG